MSSLTTTSNFTTSGLPIGTGTTSMTYLYGIADFFGTLFEDKDVVNLMLEAQAHEASDIYSNFLQLTSSLSLSSIQQTSNSAIKLVFINTSQAVGNSTNVFTLDESIQSTRLIANQPLLPSTLIEADVDYYLSTSTDGTTTITFAQPISSYGLYNRVLSDGVTTQYALWFVDVAVDEKFISKFYGNLIGVSEANSTDSFYNFIYGLYYVYTQGPTIDSITKGLNLTLGIPLARTTETVLDIRTYLQTDQYLVITSENQYVIPYGIAPSVSVGDTLNVGDEIAAYVEVKDYVENGNWWINLEIPESIIPYVPAGQKDRYATEGSQFDLLMRQYLKTHTFLVNVNVTTFESIQQFAQLSDIIDKVKPSHTQPVYIWSVYNENETITLVDTLITFQVQAGRCENLGLPIGRFYRGNSSDPISRSCAQFCRFNVPNWVSKQSGTDTYINSGNININGEVITGFRNAVSQFRSNTGLEVPWMATVINRNSDVWFGTRSLYGFNRGTYNVSEEVADGTAVNVSLEAWGVPAGMKMVPLYVTTDTDVASKCAAVGTTPPTSFQWSFNILGGPSQSKAINAYAINTYPNDTTGPLLQSNYETLFFRGSTVGYISYIIPDVLFNWAYAPAQGDIESNDYILGVRIATNAIGVYWVTSNYTNGAPFYSVVDERDPLKVTYDMPLTRGGGWNGTPFYVLRGVGMLNYSGVATGINEAAINASGTESSPTLVSSYVDSYNPAGTVINRSGVSLTHAIESW